MKLKMNFKNVAFPLSAAVVAAAVPRAAHADRRAYGETYEAVTAPKGELDVELWSTYARLGEIDGGPAARGVREMVELEYGITDRWDVAVYNMFDVTSGAAADRTDSGYAGFKLETRYRPSQRGEWFVDPVLYFELQDRLRGDAAQSYELKLILAKDLGRVNLALNVALEEERTTEPAWNTEVEYAYGTSYELTPAWKLGGEVFGKAEKGDPGGVENRTWIGPAISWATGAGGAMKGLWVTAAGGVGLQSDADSVYGRLIVGLQF
jgi:hypothetical protein